MNNIRPMNRTPRHIILTALLLLIGSAAMAQNDPQYVIKKDGNYLAHVSSGSTYTLTNADTFNPSTCLWYSGPNVEYNYYFIDNNGVRRYLSAPLALSGALEISETTPPTVVLNKPHEDYFFYDWDDGLARGVQLDLLPNCDSLYHGLNEDEDQCWKVVWVSYEGSWQMSSVYGYNPTPNAARFKRVTIHNYAAQVIPAENPGGAPTIADFAIAYGDTPHQVNGTASNFSYIYTPAYTSYTFDGNTYYFDANGNTLASAPTATTITNDPATGYAWELTGPGVDYLSLSNTTGATTSVTYHTQNTTSSHKMATLKLTVTYEHGGTEVRTATVTAKTQCQNPEQAAEPVVSYEDVTLSWLPTADKYKLEYKKSTESWSQAVKISDITATTYTIGINDLEYNKNYDYRVAAFCNGAYLPVEDDEFIYHFTTNAEPDVIILGAVYGGGRMADVTGDTEVLMINCDSVNGVFGGNDIAGTVSGGSTITLGVNEGDANATAYNGGAASTRVRVFDVYGGGNGYYAYNGSSFEAATSEYNSQSVAVHGQVKAMTQLNQLGEVVWTNEGSEPKTLIFPKIKKTAIVVANDAVKVDSLFGGAKNAFLTFDNWRWDGDSIAINGGTIFCVFGGNNIGGSQGKGKHHIEINNTTTETTNYYTKQLGRDFGIAYLFGGGNKVYGSTTEIFINGGQMDTIFAGGNSASVYAANLTVNCDLDNTYSDAIYRYTGNTIDSINAAYSWNGYGVYNVRTLFGGNNKAMMTCLPNINLTSGSLGTVYGGGNAGDMMAHDSLVGPEISFDPTLHLENLNFEYGTKVVVNSPTVLIDYLYGGCQMSNVGYSTWVRMLNGHVGTVYGGCNISGDVGSTRQDMTLGITDRHYQDVHGATYVEALGGTIHTDIFAGSNGFYHCVNGEGIYTDEINYTPHSYVGMTVPTHNETHVVLNESVVVNRNVYAGGNMAPVGFTHTLAGDKPYPADVGLASVRMIGGEVKGDVYGGGNMASINGSNEVRVAGGSIGTGPNGGALYGGNDRLGQAGKISNRVLPDTYNTASDNNTPLTSSDSYKKVNTYIGVTGKPYIHTVYGGGNGAYDYEHGAYCHDGSLPIQSNIFVDIAIEGGDDGGYIENVYGGGNGVEANGFMKVFLNVQNCTGDTRDHVGTIFGGNNIGDMDLIPDIILLHGNVHTVYGGCNKGGLVGDSTLTVNDVTYEHMGGYVHLRKEYTVTNTTLPGSPTITTPTTASVTGAVYGGCRMNGVTNNTLVLVDGGTHPASMFGGSDISGNVNRTSRVIVNGGTTGSIYGGGNGNYYYDGNRVYDINHTILIDTIESGTVTAPVSAVSQVDILGGQVGATGINNARNVFGGGLGQYTSTTGNVTVNIGNNTTGPNNIYGDVYGGSALGRVNTSAADQTIVNILNGTITGDVYGGGLGDTLTGHQVEAKVYGKTYVNVGSDASTGNISFNTYLDAESNTCGGNVYGGNNLNGSPQDSVFVNIYKTAHINTIPGYDTCPDLNTLTALQTNASSQGYAIQAVYGGGNLAAYTPTLTTANKPKSATVHVYTCQNTVKDVYGGGNAADVGTDAVGANTFVVIDGGRFQRIFNGGNGAVSPANIYGTATADIRAGLADQVFGGGNMQGSIDSTSLLLSHQDAGCSNSNEVFSEVFGGGNQAPFEGNLTTTINCGVGTIGSIYGGSNLADVTGDITLSIRGGVFTDVFGGCKGKEGTLSSDSANITGNVTLNLEGGTIRQAFGGSNINGNITGKITVNVLDTVASCGLQLDTVYGSGNLTAYTPDPAIASPEVNILKGIVNKVVFGGGKGTTAVVTANPKVTIGDNTHPAYITKVYGEVFGGGNAAPVNGNTTVICQANHATDTIYYLFGGGNEAGVNNNATVTMNSGVITQGIYGGCNTQGTVGGNINVDIYNGTLGTDSHPMTEGIYGGGKGSDTHTSGNITVTIGDGTTPAIYADVYGGSAFGQVGAAGRTAKVDLKAGTIHGSLYGGGKGDNTNTAEVTGDAELAIAGNVTNGVYGGCNVRGIVKEDVTVGVTGAAVIGDQSNTNRGIVYGGGLGENTVVNGNVAVTVNNASGHIYGDVYGGSAKGVVNCTWDTDHYVHTSDDTTGVTFTSGTIHGNLYGGGHGLDNASANVYGPVTVNIDGGTVGNVFGCNNLNGAPLDTVILYVTAGTMDSIFGGGNRAAYTSPLKPGTTKHTNYPALNISGGEVKYKVVGGGNAAGITGNPTITISNGTFCSTNQYAKSGIYGGCNTSGTVDGDIVLTITGDATNHTVIGTSAGINTDKTPVNIHGGGYGVGTSTTGSVTINYGNDTDVASEYPKLYGDIYGGSALGEVNSDGADSTNVNLLNGSFGLFYEVIAEQEHQYGGNIYGGGLGQASPAIEATVKGKVHVNVGAPTNTAGTYIGKADLYNCNVYGCNNVKGTPLDDVYVSVYQSKRTAGLNTVDDEDFAIKNVFGGGNVAHYVPSGAVNTNSLGHKTHVTVYGCDNTIKYVYGGGNAADVVGAITLVDGGHFDEMFGGGNGLVTPANIGTGGVCFHAFGGHVNYQYEGSNRQGENIGSPNKVYELYTNYNEVPGFVDCGDLYVDSYFFGDNEAEHIGDLNSEISCEIASFYHFVNVYAGSRYAVLYGNITLRVQGGEIQNLFGGSRGYAQRAADVRKYPTQEEIDANPDKYSDAIKAYMQTHSELAGRGGNITLIIEGGVVGTVYGGCDVNGNVEGEIKVVVDSTSTECPMFVGDVYGASRLTDYAPTNPNITYPEVKILKGTIGGSTTFTMGTTMTIDKDFEGNVFGGGFQGDVTANPKVIIGNVGNSNKVLIKGNVFGGGDRGDVIGSPQVIIVPTE